MAKGKQTSLLQAKTSRRAGVGRSAQVAYTDPVARPEVIKVKVKATLNATGGFDLAYSRSLIHKRRGKGSVLLELVNADAVGCQFATPGFRFRSSSVLSSYCESIERTPTLITLNLDNQYQTTTDIFYDAFVVSTRTASGLAMRAGTGSRSVSKSWLSREMNLLESEAMVVVDHVMAIQQQLMSRGPIIRNDPR